MTIRLIVIELGKFIYNQHFAKQVEQVVRKLYEGVRFGHG